MEPTTIHTDAASNNKPVFIVIMDRKVKVSVVKGKIEVRRDAVLTRKEPV